MKYLIRFFLMLFCHLLHPAYADETGSQFTSIADIELGTLTLEQVADKLGHSKMQFSGEGGESQEVICYRTNDGYLSFLSGEMGGPKHTLLGFGISGKGKHQDCPEITPKFANVKLRLAGLHLGMSKNEFERAIGKKAKWDGVVGRASFQTRVPMTPDQIKRFSPEHKDDAFFDLSVSIVGKFSGGKLAAFEVWKVESL